MVGTSKQWLSVRARSLSEGRFISDADNAAASAVTVQGPTTASELFGLVDPVGQSVTINSIPFTVVGLLKPAGSDSTSNLDDQAIVPLSTMISRLSGASGRDTLSSVYVAATSNATVSAAYQEVDAVLLDRHSITSSASADFTITAQDSLLTTASSVSRTLTVLLRWPSSSRRRRPPRAEAADQRLARPGHSPAPAEPRRRPRPRSRRPNTR